MSPTQPLNELALFAGAGGGILGGKLLGWRTVCAVEIQRYPRNRLLDRQDDRCLEPFPIWDDVTTFNGTPWAGRVDVVSGGFPCQDISVAGRGKGITGERSGLWRHMARIIGEVRPRYAFIENSPALKTRGLKTVLRDLADMGYDARWGVLGAIHAGAPHRRLRIWIVAHRNCSRQLQPKRFNTEFRRRFSNSGTLMADATEHRSPSRISESTTGQERIATKSFNDCALVADAMRNGADEGFASVSSQTGFTEKNTGRKTWSQFSDGGFDDTDTDVIGQQTRRSDKALHAQSASGHGPKHVCPKFVGADWWSTEPRLGRVAHGVANRVDRIKAIGNGQVPAVAALAWTLLSPHI
jgi:DNA (cytosine-5)-methyltransferase 1